MRSAAYFVSAPGSSALNVRLHEDIGISDQAVIVSTNVLDEALKPS